METTYKSFDLNDTIITAIRGRHMTQNHPQTISSTQYLCQSVQQTMLSNRLVEKKHIEKKHIEKNQVEKNQVEKKYIETESLFA